MPGAPGRFANLEMPVALEGGDTAFCASLVAEGNAQAVVIRRADRVSIIRGNQVDAVAGDARPFLSLAANGANPLAIARTQTTNGSRISLLRLEGDRPAVLVPDLTGAIQQSDSNWHADNWSVRPAGFALLTHFWPGRLGFTPASSSISVFRGDTIIPIAVTRSTTAPPFIGFIGPELNPEATRVTFGGILSNGSNDSIPTAGLYVWENGATSTVIDPSATFNGTRVAIGSFGLADEGAVAAVDQSGNRILLWQAGRFTELVAAGARAADGTMFEMGNPLPVPAILRVDSMHVYFTAARRGKYPLGNDGAFLDLVFRVARNGGPLELFFDPRRVFSDLARIQLTNLSLTGDTPQLTFLVREVFGSQQAIYSGTAPFSAVDFPAVPSGYPRLYLEDRGSGYSTRAGVSRALEVQSPDVGPFSYAWSVNGVPISETSDLFRGAAMATLQLAPFAQKYHAGVYTVAVTSAAGTSYATATVEVDAYFHDGNGSLPLLVNTSVRGYTAPGEGIFTAGITLVPPLTSISYGSGAAGYGWKPGTSQNLLVRAAGPGLAPFTRGDVVPAPATALALYSGPTLLGRNDGAWDSDPRISDTAAAVGAFPLPPASRDSAMLVDLPSGMYTAQAAAPAGDGTALLEFYVVSGEGNIRNISARGFVTDTEPRSLTLGFVIRRARADLPGRAVLLRAAGPALKQFGIENTLSRPRLELYSADNTRLAINSGHDDAPNRADIDAVAREYGAFAFEPGSADAAVLLHLPEGVYIARVTAAPGAPGGVVLAELYAQIGF